MKRCLILMVGLGLIVPAWGGESCYEQLAEDLLRAIQGNDSFAISKFANNSRVFDSQTIEYLVGESVSPFHGRPDLKAAHAVLKGKKVISKIVITETVSGVRNMEVVYLPVDMAPDFESFARMVAEKKALPFRDYIVCSIVIDKSEAYMPHACYAETDVLD